MKKRSLSKLTVKRISTSPYFKESFARLEKETIQQAADTIVLPLNSPESADVLITNTHTVTAEISAEDLERCQLMIHPNSGYDNLKAEFVTSAKFPIIIGNPIRAHAVANFILSALLTHYSKLPSHKQWDSGRKWPRKLLNELSILILGYGHIGKILESSLLPLAKKIQVHDPYLGMNALDLNNVDVVIPACSLNPENYHLIDREFLLTLNEDFTLINAARGQLVKTADLISVLKDHPHAFAFLDVFEKEPTDFSIFDGIKNIQLSSHIAGVYSNIDEITAKYVASVIADFQSLDEEKFNKKYCSVLLNTRLKNGVLV